MLSHACLPRYSARCPFDSVELYAQTRRPVHKREPARPRARAPSDAVDCVSPDVAGVEDDPARATFWRHGVKRMMQFVTIRWQARRAGSRSELMRTDIYYWKCDNPLSFEEKRLYNEKYRRADIAGLVAEIGALHFPGDPVRVAATGSAGNHYAYLLHLPEATYFFRADDGKLDDDYMEAESVAMALARERGVPVPELVVTDTTLARFPVRYQILECVPHSSLREHDQNGSLDRRAVSEQLGGYLAALHSITGEGFGFLDTELLRRDGTVRGLDRTHPDYFHKRLDDHLAYLHDVGFLDRGACARVEAAFAHHAGLLDIQRPAMLHKDMAFWNVLGTHDRVAAIVDWDDVVLGDPVDDLAIVRCFYDADVFDPLVASYTLRAELPEDFDARLWLYVLRNMLWKAKIRHFMGYFEMDESFFIRSRENSDSLEAFTHARIDNAMAELERL